MIHGVRRGLGGGVNGWYENDYWLDYKVTVCTIWSSKKKKSKGG